MTDRRQRQGFVQPHLPKKPAHIVRGAVVLAIAALLSQAASAESLRCDGALVKVGDAKARLLAACGEPLSRDVVAVVRALADGKQVRARYAETWSYETAGVAGYRLLRFEGARLVGDGMRCPTGLVKEGDATSTVRQKCGEPASRDAAGLVAESPGPAAPAVLSESLVEQWVYSMGEGSLLRIVSVRAGRIESIENGPRQ